MSLFQSNLRKQIRNLPKILNFVKKIHYYSNLFTSLLNEVKEDEEKVEKAKRKAEKSFEEAMKGDLGSVLKKMGRVSDAENSKQQGMSKDMAKESGLLQDGVARMRQLEMEADESVGRAELMTGGVDRGVYDGVGIGKLWTARRFCKSCKNVADISRKLLIFQTDFLLKMSSLERCKSVQIL